MSATSVSGRKSVSIEQLAVNGGQAVATAMVPFMSVGLTEADVDAGTAVLRSGMLRQATKCAELEERFGKMSGASHALSCANGTCALQLAYGALFKPGDDVLVPAWTYIATASMIVAAGAHPIFCDCREDTFQIDMEDAAKRITPKTTAIACTHLYGCPVDIDAVQKFASKHGLKVIYDAAQAHLAKYKGKGVAAYGDATTYSFYATKNLGTGEGGMVMCNNSDVASRIASLRSHGETDKYLHEHIGFNYRMNDITAAVGCSKLDRLEDETSERCKAAKKYNGILSEIDGLSAPTITAQADPVWHLYTVKMDLAKFSCTRDEFCDALKAEGVPTAVHYPRSLTRQPAFKDHVTDHPPIADGMCKRVFSLPMHAKLTEAHFKTIEQALHKVTGAFSR